MGKSVLITCLTSNMTMLFLHFDTGRSIEFKNLKLSSEETLLLALVIFW